MNAIRILLFCLILLDTTVGAHKAGEEADNGNGELFGQMWRNAFASNGHNEEEEEEGKEMTTKVKEEQMGEDEEENEIWKNVKKEPFDDKVKEEKEEKTDRREKWQKSIKKEPKSEANEIWKNVKKEPFDDKVKEEKEEKTDRREKGQKSIKKEPKSEANELEDLVVKGKTEETDQQQNSSTSDQNDLDGAYKRVKSETDQLTDEQKLRLIKAYDKMREEYKRRAKNNVVNPNAKIIENKIANKLGIINRDQIYLWKKELNRKKKEETVKEKLEIVKKFVKMRNERKTKNGYKNQTRAKIEQEIAKELGISRLKIYKWKKELNKLIEKKSEREKEKREIVEKFDKMRKEQRNSKKGCKNEKRGKIEQEIAKELGTYREKIYRWKKELCPSHRHNAKQKRLIIEHFEKLREEFSSKFHRKANREIDERIAQKFGISQRTIYRWKKEAFEK